jgi:hypothetical protein
VSIGIKDGTSDSNICDLTSQFSFPILADARSRDSLPIRSRHHGTHERRPVVQPIKWETGMPMYNSTVTTELRRFGLGKNHVELAQFIEGHVNRAANGRIRDLHVVYSDEKIILQGRSRTYHAKQLAQQAVLDLTDGHPLLANQIVVL